ncbi:hypothetical protein RRG08_003765 [Elysia crispata]|uniref:Secreted protein n=1 Tax=Elysia crispata TaxID=231223 RepID=A0AAE1AV69_9GAST|nr:hypothetical protein RRG08_003765 [Elysia crispata]
MHVSFLLRASLLLQPGGTGQIMRQRGNAVTLCRPATTPLITHKGSSIFCGQAVAMAFVSCFDCDQLLDGNPQNLTSQVKLHVRRDLGGAWLRRRSPAERELRGFDESFRSDRGHPPIFKTCRGKVDCSGSATSAHEAAPT